GRRLRRRDRGGARCARADRRAGGRPGLGPPRAAAGHPEPRGHLHRDHQGRGGGGAVRNVLAIAWREIRTYFTSPLAYVVIGVFLALSGYIFWARLVRFSELCLRFGSNPYFLN